MHSRYPLAASLAFLGTLAAGGVAHAGPTGPTAPTCAPLQVDNVLGGAQVCPVTVAPDVDIAPTTAIGDTVDAVDVDDLADLALGN